jgi:hypothetical protein
MYTTLVNVFKTTTMFEYIASEMTDPRPWFIVFGKRITDEVFREKAISYLNSLISTFCFTESYLDSRENLMIALGCYRKNLVILPEQKKEFSVQFNLIREFLSRKSPKRPKLVSMDANYVHLFNYFSFITGEKENNRISSGNYVKVEYFDFPSHYATTYPYCMDGSRFFFLGLDKKKF